MAGRRRGSIARKVLWGVAGYCVTTLGTLLTTYLTELDISSLVGSVLATAVEGRYVLISNRAPSGKGAPVQLAAGKAR